MRHMNRFANDIIDLFNRQFILSLEQINKKLPQYNQFELMNALSQNK